MQPRLRQNETLRHHMRSRRSVDQAWTSAIACCRDPTSATAAQPDARSVDVLTLLCTRGRPRLPAKPWNEATRSVLQAERAVARRGGARLCRIEIRIVRSIARRLLIALRRARVSAWVLLLRSSVRLLSISASTSSGTTDRSSTRRVGIAAGGARRSGTDFRRQTHHPNER